MSNGSGGNYMLDGRLISGATPADGNVLTWVTADRCWEPRPASSVLPLVVIQDYYIDGVTGLDTNTGLTKTAPLATIQGFFTKYGYEVPLGSQRRVHLAGTGGVDPWVTPTGQQTYSIDEIDVGTNGPVGNRTVFRGPQNLIRGIPATGPATAALDVMPGGCLPCLETNVANPAGQRTRLNFAGAGWTANDFSVYGQGYKLRITRAGAKVIFECPIADNGVDFIIVDVLGLAAIVLATDTFEIVYPAARIRGFTNYGGGIRICTIKGTGAEMLSLAALTTADMGHSFERLVIEDVMIQGKFITFDRCCFIPGPFNGGPITTGSSHFKNSMAVQIPTSFNQGGVGYTLQGSNIPRPDGPADPINQVICIQAMVCGLHLGQTASASPGYFSADGNLSSYGATGPGILAIFGSSFIQRAACAYLGGNANTTFGIECQDGSIATVLGGTAAATGTATQIVGTTNALRVDTNAGVAYGNAGGAFGDAASFNGNYHITNGATWTGHMSNIHI